MTITSAHLLKLFPMDEKVREEALAKIGTFTPDQNLQLSRTLWKMFYQLLDEQAEYEFYRIRDKAREGGKQVDILTLKKETADAVYERFIRDASEGKETFVAQIFRRFYWVTITALVKDILEYKWD